MDDAILRDDIGIHDIRHQAAFIVHRISIRASSAEYEGLTRSGRERLLRGASEGDGTVDDVVLDQVAERGGIELRRVKVVILQGVGEGLVDRREDRDTF